MLVQAATSLKAPLPAVKVSFVRSTVCSRLVQCSVVCEVYSEIHALNCHGTPLLSFLFSAEARGASPQGMLPQVFAHLGVLSYRSFCAGVTGRVNK